MLTTLNLCASIERIYIGLIQMSMSEIITARVELPCSIRIYARGLGATRGVTEELSRESLVVIASSMPRADGLGRGAHIAVGIELPHSREFPVRLLECTAMVSSVHPAGEGLRIAAKVNRMSIKDRDSGKFVRAEYGAILNEAQDRVTLL